MYISDLLLNGKGSGPVGELVASMGGTRFDPGLLRPYFNRDGHPCVTVNTGRTELVKDANGNPVINAAGDTVEKVIYEVRSIPELMGRGIYSPVFNATSLRKDEWIHLDRKIILAARKRLKAWADLSAASSIGGFNAMGKAIYEYQTASDPGEAVVDMDGLAEGRNDAPVFGLEGIPLPITHSDFWFSRRQLMISQNDGTPLNTFMGEAAGRRVAEKIEQTVIGTVTGMEYGDSTAYGGTSKVYGYLNFPGRITYTSLTAPNTGGWTPDDFVNELIAIRELLYAQNKYGPFMVYTSSDWDTYLDRDYALTGGNNPSQTLRNRARQIDGITDIKRLDYLTPSTNPFTLIVVQMDPETAAAINGMDITTVQWESQGGARLNFKVMAIQVPLLREDYYGQCGIVHATTV